MNNIHETALIDPSAQLGDGNVIGPYCVIGPNVKIGDNNKLHNHICIGTPAQHRDDVPVGGVEVGNDNIFHEFSQVHLSTNPDLPTRVSNNCYLMKGAHIAHDCMVEDNVTLCNDATLGGHTYVMRNTTLGFMTSIHQRKVVGSYIQTGMGAVAPKKLCMEPGYIYAGNPARQLKQNAIGLERAGISADALADEVRRFNTLCYGWGVTETRPELTHED